MGRLPKKGVEYFPHDTIAASMPTLFVMQAEFGNDGYAFWFKLLEFLGMKATLSADFTDRKRRVNYTHAIGAMIDIASISFCQKLIRRFV